MQAIDRDGVLPGRPLPDDFRLELPGYQIHRVLGVGGMGIVYLGLQTSLSRWVAIKAIVPGAADAQAHIKRLHREARALSRLQHPHIVGCLDLIEKDGGLYLVMDYVHGWYSLKDVLKRYEQVDQAYVVRIGLHAARALDHASRHDVLHRDIKPANLLVYHEFDGPPPHLRELFAHPETQVKICDFGLTKSTDPENQHTRLTVHGTSVGSPVYMAPEQARAEACDFRADMYALGTTLFHLLTGTTPFHAENRMKALELKVSLERFPSPRDYGVQVHRDLETVLRRMTMYSPALRYGSYTEFIPELERLDQRFKASPDEPGQAGFTRIIQRLRRKLGG